MRKNNEKNKTDYFSVITIIFIVSVIPLIVTLYYDKLEPIESQNWRGESAYSDFFHYYKSQWFIIATVLTCFSFLIKSFFKGRLDYKKSQIYIPTFIYAFFIVLSTALSQYPSVAINGFVGKHEGMILLLCYLIIFLLTFNIVKDEKQMKGILAALIASSVIIGLVGLGQFLGFDLFKSDLGRLLFIPSQYSEDKLIFHFGERSVFSTLGNSNYMGSYIALVLPIVVVSLFVVKNKALKIILGFVSLLLMINLVGSQSRAGLIGVAFSFLLLAIFLWKRIFQNKRIAIILTLSTILLFFVTNMITGGKITKILSSFTERAVSTESQFFDLKNIEFGENSVTIISGTEQFKIAIEDDTLLLQNQLGQDLEYTWAEASQSSVMQISDPIFKDYGLTLSGNILTITNKNASFSFSITDRFRLIGINNTEHEFVEKAPAIGGTGIERFGSGRGYIWSRTIPLLKDTLFVGSGPDIYAITFPQHDYIGKIRVYGTPQMVVDKPHNMYLQIAVCTGVLSLISVLVLFFLYLISSVKLFTKYRNNNDKYYIGIAVFAAICGYLASVMANDSIVATSSIFWVLLGIGFAINEIIKNDVNPKHALVNKQKRPL